MLEAFERIWDGHLKCINVAKHHIDFHNNDVRPDYSARYGSEQTTKKFVGLDIS